MLTCHIKRVLIVGHRVDFRKGFNGLLGECYKLECNPFEGDCVVFLKADRTQIRVMFGDDVGLYLLSRRFEMGRIKPEWLNGKSVKHSISQGELSLLLEGASFVVHRRVKKWAKNKNSV